IDVVLDAARRPPRATAGDEQKRGAEPRPGQRPIAHRGPPRACRVRTRSATSRAPRQYATAWRGAMPGRLHRAGRPPSRRDIVARNESLERAPGRAAIARGPIDRRAMDVHDGHEVAPNPPP